MKKLMIIIVGCLLVGCSQASVEVEEGITTLPIKEIAESTLAKDSPINAMNIDEYLFLEDCLYVDTREWNQFNKEGHIAGFVNYPFYELFADFTSKENVLFTMSKLKDDEGKVIVNVGDTGSFIANYKESETIINDLFPKDRNIVFMSTAGVEATYLMNLLVQLGYDPSRLYNAGSYSNSMGSAKAYKDLTEVKYNVAGTDVFSYVITTDWGELTPVTE